jgi:hypothetical protein
VKRVSSMSDHFFDTYLRLILKKPSINQKKRIVF